MGAFVLIHGGAHGSWCWDRLVPHLAAAPGVDDVLAVDLPGRGARPDDPPSDEIGIGHFVDAVVGDVEAHGLDDVVLVGHSLAGLTLGPASARLGDRVRRVVHVSTSVPPPGRTMFEHLDDPRSPLSREVDVEAMFCSDLDDETSEWLRSHLGPEPIGPMSEIVQPVALPADLPVTYVVLTEDRALPPDYQREQAATAGASEIVEFAAGHSAFASRPADLAALLARYA